MRFLADIIQTLNRNISSHGYQTGPLSETKYLTSADTCTTECLNNSNNIFIYSCAIKWCNFRASIYIFQQWNNNIQHLHHNKQPTTDSSEFWNIFNDCIFCRHICKHDKTWEINGHVRHITLGHVFKHHWYDSYNLFSKICKKVFFNWFSGITLYPSLYF